jgi:transcriptional regulator with XRE-family HTH domain
MVEVNITQVKAARALLDWRQPDLAREAGISLATVKRFETGVTPIPVVKAAITNALEKAGVVFESDGKYVGVRLKIKRGK